MSAVRDRIVEVLKWISIVLFVVLVAVVMWQVFTRQVLQSPSGWTTTVAQYLFIWLVLFSVAMVFGERGHVAVDFFARLLPKPAQRVTNALVQLSILLFAVLGLFWGGVRGMSISWDQAIPGLPATVGQMYLALPIAGVLIAVFAAVDLLRALRGEELLEAGGDAQQKATIAAVEDAEARPLTEGGADAAPGSSTDRRPGTHRADPRTDRDQED